MALINKPYTFSAGATIVASEHNSNFDTLYNEVNGSLSNANISSMAGITDSKLAQLTTAGKVSGAALTLLTSVPSGAGLLPTANLGSGTADNTMFLRGDQTWALPTATAANALSGSVVQTVRTKTATYASLGSTAIPNDNSLPRWDEGNEISAIATSITANSASNEYRITVSVNIGLNGTVGFMVLAMYLDPSAGADTAIRVASEYMNDTVLGTISATFYVTPADTASHTYKFRVGTTGGNASYLNGNVSGRLYGGASISSVTIEEIKA